MNIFDQQTLAPDVIARFRAGIRVKNPNKQNKDEEWKLLYPEGEKEHTVYMYLLPSRELLPTNYPIKEVIFHNLIKVPELNIPGTRWLSLETNGRKDPLAEFKKWIKKNIHKDDPLYRGIVRRGTMRYFLSNVLIVSDKAQPEKEGTVQIATLPSRVVRYILEYEVNRFDAGMPPLANITKFPPILKMHAIRNKTKGQGGHTRYDLEFMTEAIIDGKRRGSRDLTPDFIEEIGRNLFDLRDMPVIKLTAAQVDAKLRKMVPDAYERYVRDTGQSAEFWYQQDMAAKRA